MRGRLLRKRLSALVRQRLWEWWLSTAYTRLEPGGAVVLIMTRWHEDDLAGRLLDEVRHDGEPWEVLNLPAICEEGPDALERMPGDALWPERFSAQELAIKRESLEAFWWTALYQQRPSPTGGGMFQRAWFSQRHRELPIVTETVQAVDSAFKEGVGSDYSVIATWGTDGRKYCLVDLWRARVQYPELRRAVQDQYARWRPHAMLVEDAASGQSIIQELRRETSLPVIAVPAKGSKQNRADAVAPLFEAGKVWLPEYAPWAADFIEEHVGFPRAAHDDMVDTSSMALARLRGLDREIAVAINSTPEERAAYEQAERDVEAARALQQLARRVLGEDVAEQVPPDAPQRDSDEAAASKVPYVARTLAQLQRWTGGTTRRWW